MHAQREAGVSGTADNSAVVSAAVELAADAMACVMACTTARRRQARIPKHEVAHYMAVTDSSQLWLSVKLGFVCPLSWYLEEERRQHPPRDSKTAYYWE